MVSLSKLNQAQHGVTAPYIVLTGSTAAGVTTNPITFLWNDKSIYHGFLGFASLVGHVQCVGTNKTLKAYIKPIYANKSSINGLVIKSKTAQVLTLASISGVSVTASITASGAIETFEHRLSSTVAWMKASLGIEVYFGITASATAAGSTVYNIDGYVLTQQD